MIMKPEELAEIGLAAAKKKKGKWAKVALRLLSHIGDIQAEANALRKSK